MALQLTTELSSGATGEYYKITQLSLQDGVTQVELALYKDAAARLADKTPLTWQIKVFKGADNPCTLAAMSAVGANPIALCYTKLKTLPELASALDV